MRGCPRRAASRCVYRLAPPLHGALAEVELVHDLAPGLAGVVEVDYPPLEIVGEMPRVPGVPHMRPSRLLRPSRNCPHRCSQSGVGGDAVHLPRPRPGQGRTAAVGQQHGRGRGELAAEGRPAQPPGADVGRAREGGVPVVPRALGGREGGAREARRDADRRGHRLPVQRLLRLAVARGRRAGVRRRGRAGGSPPRGPSPVLAGLMDGNGCSIGRHVLSYKLPNASHHVKSYVLWIAWRPNAMRRAEDKCCW